ncbi:MAG TPA: cystathionine gamma-lyase [Thermoleophilaceae bacterium]|jgi:cystathionine gamma-lyase|nr:cystathionine gamma-lyase [Thermoleophilaceae bacterium]
MSGRSTRVVRAGLPQARQGEPFLPGPVFAAPYHLSGDPDSSPASYGRYANPTWEAYERALGSLEEAEAVLFSSGMAAVAALMLTELRPGSVLAIDSSSYHGVRRLAASHLEVNGVEVRLAAPVELPTAAKGATVLWLETPSNPKLEVYDIAALAAVADSEGTLTVVDNTTAGALLQRPLDLGAGAVMTSATKQMSGHADLLLGYVTTRDGERAQRLRDWRRVAGSIPGPFEAWLAHRSLATLGVRLERACANAAALAELIAARDDVASVAYPGLTSDPGHEIARRQMSGFGAVLSFDLETADRAERFLAAAQLVTDATSFGSVHTTAERRARWGGDDVSEGFIRFSAGIEDTADLVADVDHALDACFS